jgi:hypothetical protein
MPNILVAQIGLQRPGIVASVRQCVAAGVPKHDEAQPLMKPARALLFSVAPKIAERLGRKLSVAHGVSNIAVTQVVLD